MENVKKLEKAQKEFLDIRRWSDIDEDIKVRIADKFIEILEIYNDTIEGHLNTIKWILKEVWVDE